MLGFLLCAATLLASVLVLPASDGGTVDPLDWLGALLLARASAALLLVISQGAGWGPLPTVLVGAVGVVTLTC